MFGHEKGAFTGAIAQHKGVFEQAGSGTLFLDEIGELDLDLQSQLLRVLRERKFRRPGGTAELPFKGRVICASHRNLKSEVAAGRFRADLYHRLCVIDIRLPPWRERGDDLFLIAEDKVRSISRETGKRIAGFAPEVIETFRRYS